MALRCVDCDRWDLREAVLVDEDGIVLLRGTACPHCRRHRAEHEDEYAEARYADHRSRAAWRGGGRYEDEDLFAADPVPAARLADNRFGPVASSFDGFDDDPFDERASFAFRT
jgi:hypothetical protein